MNRGGDDREQALEIIDLEPATAATTTERTARSGMPRRRGPVVIAIVVVVALVVSVVAGRSHHRGRSAASPSTTDASKTVIRLHGGGLFPFRVGAQVLTAGDDGLRIVDTDTGHIGVPSIAGLPAAPATIVASSAATVALRVGGQMYWFTLVDGIAHRIAAHTAFAAVDTGHVWLAGDRYATEVPGDPSRLPRSRVATTAPAIGATRRGLLERTPRGYVIQPIDGSTTTKPFLPAGARVIGVHPDRVAWVSDCTILRCSVHVTEVSSGASTTWVQLANHPNPLELADTVAVFPRDGRRVAIIVPDNTITHSTSVLVADLHDKATASVDTTGYITPPARPGTNDGAGATVTWTDDGIYLLLAPAAGTGDGRLAIVDANGDPPRVAAARAPLDLGSSSAVVGTSILGALPPQQRLGQFASIAADAVPPPRPGVQLLAADDREIDVLDLGTNDVRSITVSGYEPNPAGTHSIARVSGGWLVVRSGVVDLIRDGATEAPIVDAGSQVYSANDGRTAWIVTAGPGGAANVESYDPATGTLGTQFSAPGVVGASDAGLVVPTFTGVGFVMTTFDASGHEHPGRRILARTIRIVAIAGHEVLYESGTFLRAFDLANGQDELLTTYPKQVALSPNGVYAAWTTGAGDHVGSERFTDGVTDGFAMQASRVLVGDDGTLLAIDGSRVSEGHVGGARTRPYDGLSIGEGAELALG